MMSRLTALKAKTLRSAGSAPPIVAPLEFGSRKIPALLSPPLPWSRGRPIQSPRAVKPVVALVTLIPKAPPVIARPRTDELSASTVRTFAALGPFTPTQGPSTSGTAEIVQTPPSTISCEVIVGSAVAGATVSPAFPSKTVPSKVISSATAVVAFATSIAARKVQLPPTVRQAAEESAASSAGLSTSISAAEATTGKARATRAAKSVSATREGKIMRATLSVSVGGRETRAAALPLHLAAALGGGAADYVVPLVQHPLQLGDGLRRVGGDFGGELQGGALGPGGGGYSVDETEAQGLVGADGAGGEEQVLGGGEAAERHQAGWADRDAQGGAGEAHPQVGAADAHVAGDGDLGAAADDVAVAGGDRRLGEVNHLVVEFGEELHAANLALVVELLSHVGPGGEAEVVGGADHQHPDRLVAAGYREVLEQLEQHLGADRVAGTGPLEADDRDAPLLDRVAGDLVLGGAVLCAHESEAIRSTRRSVSSAAAAISPSTSPFGSLKRPST